MHEEPDSRIFRGQRRQGRPCPSVSSPGRNPRGKWPARPEATAPRWRTVHHCLSHFDGAGSARSPLARFSLSALPPRTLSPLQFLLGHRESATTDFRQVYYYLYSSELPFRVLRRLEYLAGIGLGHHLLPASVHRSSHDAMTITISRGCTQEMTTKGYTVSDD